ncbi:FAD-dependent oxidoreductase [Thermodesulfobacteriota bacterium]
MAEIHYVLIGNGTTGNRAAEILREGNKSARITLIGEEATHFVQRHKLAPFLTGNPEFDSLRTHSPDWYEERNIHLRLNQKATKVVPHEKWILLAHRERVRYDKLLICSGAWHRVPPYLSRFQTLLTRFCCSIDAILLKEKLDMINHVTLLGGDAVGLQLIAALKPTGKKITMIMDEFGFWPIELDDNVKGRLAKALGRAGVEIIGDDEVMEVSKSKNKLEILTREGKRVKTDVAVITSGMAPSLEYLGDSGIDMQAGVLVNEKLEANVPDVWAAGEVAQVYYPELKDYRCSTGYANAEIQGELAARNMLGQKKEIRLGKPGQFPANHSKHTDGKDFRSMRKIDLTVEICGSSGDGTLAAGGILTTTLAYMGYHVLSFDVYPAEIRGFGKCVAHSRISDESIHSVGREVDILVSLNDPYSMEQLPTLKSQGVAIFDSWPIKELEEDECIAGRFRPGQYIYGVPFRELSQRVTLSARSRNIVALGALAALFHIEVEPFVKRLRFKFRKKGKVANEVEATFRAGVAYVDENIHKFDPYSFKIERSKASEHYVLMTGSKCSGPYQSRISDNKDNTVWTPQGPFQRTVPFPLRQGRLRRNALWISRLACPAC